MKICKYSNCGKEYDETIYDVNGYCCIDHQSTWNGCPKYMDEINKLTPEQAYYELKRSIQFVLSGDLIHLFDMVNSSDNALKLFAGDEELAINIMAKLNKKIIRHIINDIKFEYLQQFLVNIYNKGTYYESYYSIFNGTYRTYMDKRDKLIESFTIINKIGGE